MAVNNSLQPKAQPQKFSVAIRQDKWQDLINNTLGDKGRAGRFVASITSAVAVTPFRPVNRGRYFLPLCWVRF